jgi:pimeloyl-ACP methyl ester carboxylesterase
MPTLLQRHPWTRKFELWLNQHHLASKTLGVTRPGGASTGLLLGDVEDQSRPVVIFLHGLGNDLFFPNIAFFKAILTAGYNLFAIDLDGHGLGQTSTFDQDSLRTLIPSALASLSLTSPKTSRPHLCGFSFGAALALAYVQQNPASVASLTMIAMPGRLKASPKLLTEAISPATPSWWKALNDYGFSGIHPAIGSFRRELYPVRLAPGEKKSYLEVAGQILASLDTERLLQTVPVMALGISGSLDFIALRGDSAKLLGPKNVTWRSVPRSNHFTTMLAPETARIVVDFLQGTR